MAVELEFFLDAIILEAVEGPLDKEILVVLFDTVNVGHAPPTTNREILRSALRALHERLTKDGVSRAVLEYVLGRYAAGFTTGFRLCVDTIFLGSG